jgi:hypothetical protein
MSVNNIWAAGGFIFIIASSLNMMTYSWLRFDNGIYFYFMMITLFIYGSEMFNQKVAIGEIENE